MLLGGRTAEEIALGEISTGAQNDLQRATDIARAMVTEFGMSDIARRHQLRRQQAREVPRHPDAAGARAVREETAQKIDAEIKRILTDAHASARQILLERLEQVDTIARRLLEVEVMEGDELRQILGLPVLPKATEQLVEGTPELRS